MISVVIPLYNKEAYIAETIRSVLHQTFTNFEILVVNDASNDASVSVVNGFEDERIQLITIERSGVSVARNTGIEKAKYPWIAFLDADDWWDATFLEEMLALISTYSSHKIFASGRSRVFKNKTERYQNKYLPEEGKAAVLNYFQVIGEYFPPVNSSNVIIEKSLFRAIGKFRKRQKKHEDHDLWMRLCVKNPVVLLNKELSFYRKTELDATSKTHYEADDFCIFLNTILKVKEQLSPTEKGDFRKYYKRFTFFTYIKHYWNYSHQEKKQVYGLLKQLLPKSYIRRLFYINAVPFNVYPVLKTFKRK